MEKKLKCFLSFFLAFWFCLSSAQETKQTESNLAIDSLLKVLKILSSPSVEVKLVKGADTAILGVLNRLGKHYSYLGNYKEALQYTEQSLFHAQKLNSQRGIANAYNNLGLLHNSQGDFGKALENHSKALEIQEKIGDKKGKAKSLNNSGNIYYYLGNYEKALDNYHKSIQLCEEINFKAGTVNSYSNIGAIYNTQGHFEMALTSTLKSLKIREEIGDKIGIASSYQSIGRTYMWQGNYKKALEYYFKSLEIVKESEDIRVTAFSYCAIGHVYLCQKEFDLALSYEMKALAINEKIGDKIGIASTFTNIGNIHFVLENYEKALENHFKALKIEKKIGNKLGIANSYCNIGSCYIAQNKFKDAQNYLNQSIVLYKELGSDNGRKDAYSTMADLFGKKGDFEQAYIYHKLYSDLKDTILNEKSSKQIAEMNTKYNSEKKDKELIKKDAEISKQQAETEKQNLQRNAFILGFVLVLILAFFIFRGYRQKQSANKLLEEKNLLIASQKQLVEEKNLKITDSINYAKRIQQAILPSQELIASFLPESFIFFRPKDIVSGDFYWFSEKNGKLLIAVADCTGHGVPGAFMSMIGNTLLNEIVNVKNILEPAQILNQLNKGIVSLLHQSTTESSTQDDGMDITILSIDKTNNEIEFAGANHFSYLINNNKLDTLKGDVFSIGGISGKADVNFASQKIKIEKGNTLYLFSDGFIDQFGGEKNTKFLSSRFGQLLKKNQQDDMKKQKENLIVAFDDWKGSNKQLDDLLVVGIRL